MKNKFIAIFSILVAIVFFNSYIFVKKDHETNNPKSVEKQRVLDNVKKDTKQISQFFCFSYIENCQDHGLISQYYQELKEDYSEALGLFSEKKQFKIFCQVDVKTDCFSNLNEISFKSNLDKREYLDQINKNNINLIKEVLLSYLDNIYEEKSKAFEQFQKDLKDSVVMQDDLKKRQQNHWTHRLDTEEMYKESFKGPHRDEMKYEELLYTADMFNEKWSQR